MKTTGSFSGARPASRASVFLLALSIAFGLSVFSLSEAASPGEKLPPDIAKYPTRPITFIVPWGAGGRTDTLARILQSAVEKELGVPLVVTNRPGGGGVIGTRAVQHADPDGYTIGLWSPGIFFQQFVVDPPLRFGDSTPIAGVTSESLLLSVNKNRPWKTVNEFIKYVQANPGKLRYGSSGIGSTDHVYFTAFLERVGGGQVTVVPYGGDAKNAAALARGESDATFIPLSGVMAFRDDLRFLAVASDQRIPVLADVSTMRELGIDFVAATRSVIHGPPGLHSAVVRRVEDAFRKTLVNPNVVEQLNKLVIEPSFLTSKELVAYVEEWNPRWEALVVKLGLRKK